MSCTYEQTTDEKICKPMDRLKGNKASESNGILPEMVKNCGPDTIAHILDPFSTVWKSTSRVGDAMLVATRIQEERSNCMR